MGISFAGLGGGSSSKIEKAELFNATGSWTAPASVNYVKVALVSGGGACGGVDSDALASPGGSSGFDTTNLSGSPSSPSLDASGSSTIRERNGIAGKANSGSGASGATVAFTNNGYATSIAHGQSSNTKWFGQAVTPGSSYTVTVGAGGSATNSQGAANGGSGYVTVTYYEEEV